MKLIVYEDGQDQKHLPVPCGVARPRLLRVIPNNRMYCYTKIIKEKKGMVIDVRV